ncbi:MAG: hypothetical protein HY567_03400 [Candidatus Kerfeldbacteria bacterium]|nr:hypothetical protein [Candidatus Kerfeldbacteria bacterium]
MPEARIVRRIADRLCAQGAITRKQRRHIVDRLPHHGAELSHQDLEQVLAGLPSHVVTKVLHLEQAGVTLAFRR